MDKTLYKQTVVEFIKKGCNDNSRNCLIKINREKLKKIFLSIVGRDDMKIEITVSDAKWCRALLNKYKTLTKLPKGKPEALGKTIFESLLKSDKCISATTAISLVNEFLLYFDIILKEDELKNLFTFCTFHIDEPIDINGKKASDVFKKFNNGYLLEEDLAKKLSKEYNCSYVKANMNKEDTKLVTIYNLK